LHQLLGLRLRFCLRGKYSDIFNYFFQINFVDLFWPVPAAATECKPHTLTAILFFFRKRKKNSALNIGNTAVNHSFALLLGLRLLSSSSWRIIRCQQFWFSKEIL
jgi:hypothetical protein